MVEVPYRLCVELPSSLVIYLTFSSQLLRFSDILVIGLVPLLKRKKLHVRLVIVDTPHRRFCKCIQKEAKGIVIPAGLSCRKFLT